MENLDSAAEEIAVCRRNLVPLSALDPEIAPRDVASGYRVQSKLHKLLEIDHGPLVGYKIGCTSPVMQRYLDINHPCAGGIFRSRIYKTGGTLDASRFVRVGVECEIAVRLERDLPAAPGGHTADSVSNAIAAYLPAIEIVDDRYADWRTLGAPTLIADDFFAAGVVLGTPTPRQMAPDLFQVKARALINGREAGRGIGADILGHPHNALAWLANHLAAQGTHLHQGQIVMTGSFIQTVWLSSGDIAKMEFDDLGSVEIAIS